MTLRKYSLLILFSVLAMACTQKKVRLYPPPDEVKDTSVINATPVQLDTLSRTQLIFKGLYTHGDEKSIFRDCKSGKLYWLTDSSGRLARMYSAISRYPAYPYESIYAEVKGYLKGKSSLGYASEYENELVVKSVTKTEAKNYKTECYPYEFIALGNEPFWSADIIPAENRIVLKDVGAEKAYEFPYKKAAITAGVSRYEVTNIKGDKLVLAITKSTCSDGMSDRKYLYSAAATINGKQLKGCAIRKGDQLTDNP